MKKHFLILLCIILFTTAKAQEKETTAKKVTLSAGLNVGLPLADFNLSHSFGVGAEFQYEYKVNTVTAAYGSIGYTNFFGKKFEFEEAENLNSGLIPVLVGGKVYISPQFFIGAKAGLGFVTGFGSGVGFDYQPQIGFNARKAQFNFSYNGVTSYGSSLSALLLSALYKF